MRGLVFRVLDFDEKEKAEETDLGCLSLEGEEGVAGSGGLLLSFLEKEGNKVEADEEDEGGMEVLARFCVWREFVREKGTNLFLEVFLGSFPGFASDSRRLVRS